MDLSAITTGDVVQLVGALGLGSVGGWISGGVSAVWKAKHDKATRLENARRERIAAWRKELCSLEGRRVPTESLASYQEIKQYIDEHTLMMISIDDGVPGSSRETIWIDGYQYRDVRMNHFILEKVAELERKWGLI